MKSQLKGHNSSTTNQNEKEGDQQASESRSESSHVIQMGREFSSIIEEEMVSPHAMESEANCYFDQGGATFGNESFLENRTSKPDEFEAGVQLEGTSKL